MNNISVIVVNWNGKHFLADCFDSLRKQNYPSFSVILVDNGSVDGSADFVSQQYPEVHLIRLKNNLGFCAANNIAIRSANTPYIALLNNDTIVHPMWLENLHRGLMFNSQAGFAASKMLFYDYPEIIDRAGDGYTTAATGLLRGRNQSAKHFSTPEYIFGACAGAALYRTEMLRDVGLFDEDFFLVYEDVDLSFRAQLKGYTCIFVPDAIVYHKASGSIGHNSSISVYFSQRNMEWVYIKNMPAGLFSRVLLNHFLYNIFAFFYFAAIGKSPDFIKAKWDAFKKIRKMTEKRKEIQKEKCVNNLYLRRLFYDESLISRLKSKIQHPR